MQAPIRESVLLVDDEPQVLVALEDLLSDEFTVFTAENGDSALKIIEREPNIAVVLSDQRMPKMAGDELLSRLAEESDARRILVTAFADLNAVVRAVNQGKIFAYVTKPWEREDLKLKVHQAAEQFRLSKELAYERQLLHDLMDNAPDGIYFKDKERRFLRVNRSFAERVLGVAPGELLGHRLEEVNAPEALLRLDALVEQRVIDGAPVLDLMWELPRNGASRWFSENKASIRGEDGDVIGIVGICRDITQQRTLEQQLMQAQKLDAVGQLAGGIAHDLNNLLAVIGGYGELTLEATPEGDDKREDLEQLLAATRRAENLIRQLLTFSRRQVVQPVPLDLNAVVENLEKMLHRIIGEKVEIRTVLAPVLGVVKADANQMDQVIMNLVINGRDAMPDGGTLTIQTQTVDLDESDARAIGFTSTGRFVALRVTDTGTGMSAETKRHIFEPFFTTKEVGKGTGLGLSTVYGIVKQSEGHIAVDSELGRGTSFTVYLPCVASDLQTQGASHGRVETDRALAESILLVDDNPEVRNLAGRVLRERGYTVLEAGHPEEALQVVGKVGGRIDLLLTDVMMPGGSGPQLASELRARLPELKVLYMSGFVAESILQEDLNGSESAFMEKPFSPTALVTKVRAMLQPIQTN